MMHSLSNIQLTILLNIISAVFSQINDCLTTKGKSGKCVLIVDCSPETKNSSIPDLLANICGSDNNGNVKVCCSVTEPNIDSVNPRVGDKNRKTAASSCGVTSANVQSPWLVALGQKQGSKFKTTCSGILISDIHVLGSSDCVEYYYKTGEVHHAKLGSETINDQDGIVELIKLAKRYPGYTYDKGYENNIALFKLMNRVEFTDKIKPICLPIVAPSDSQDYIATNWLIPKNSNSEEDGYSISFPSNYMNLTACNNIDPYKGNFQLNYKQICSFYRKTGKCRNLQTQPILVYQDPKSQVHYVVGVGHVGAICSYPTFVPDIYTNVFFYRDWIESIKREQ